MSAGRNLPESSPGLFRSVGPPICGDKTLSESQAPLTLSSNLVWSLSFVALGAINGELNPFVKQSLVLTRRHPHPFAPHPGCCMDHDALQTPSLTDSAPFCGLGRFNGELARICILNFALII